MKDEPVFEYHAREAVLNIVLPDNSVKEIIINSGWSFGTGDHETTRLCLKALEHLFKTQDINNVMDIGCGSGVLAIASAMLGASSVKGYDLEFSIVEEARINSRNNDVQEMTQFTTDPIETAGNEADLITANILLKTIKTLMPVISENLKEKGYFIASGIRIDEQAEAVRFIGNFGFKSKETYSENEWAALLFEKGV